MNYFYGKEILYDIYMFAVSPCTELIMSMIFVSNHEPFNITSLPIKGLKITLTTSHDYNMYTYN
jgi:hypothetical protein